MGAFHCVLMVPDIWCQQDLVSDWPWSVWPCRFTLTEYAGPGELRWRISFLSLASQADGWYLLEASSQGRQLQVEPSHVEVRVEGPPVFSSQEDHQAEWRPLIGPDTSRYLALIGPDTSRYLTLICGALLLYWSQGLHMSCHNYTPLGKKKCSLLWAFCAFCCVVMTWYNV